MPAYPFEPLNMNMHAGMSIDEAERLQVGGARRRSPARPTIPHLARFDDSSDGIAQGSQWGFKPKSQAERVTGHSHGAAACRTFILARHGGTRTCTVTVRWHARLSGLGAVVTVRFGLWLGTNMLCLSVPLGA